MAFSRTWNAAYEAQPADTENISIGASRIRDLKTDIKERGEIDHSWAGDADDGKHKQVTFLAPITTPANIADHGFLYTKDVSAKAELHWLDEDGNEVALTAVGSINAFPATTSMLFYQSAAPAGWTKDIATFDNHALRVVSSTAWSAGSKGTDPFTTVFSPTKKTVSHVLTTSQIPAHDHGIGGTGQLNNTLGAVNFRLSPGSSSIGNTKSTGGGSGHTHDIVMDVNYINVIRATKD